MASSSAPIAAQEISLEALVDAELWKTDAGSVLLARNNGRLAPQGRVTGWLLYSPGGNFDIVAVGVAETGYAEKARTDASLEMLEARFAPARFLVVKAGKLLSPMGTFGARHFSNVNPLVGQPDLYPPQYPWGLTVSGAAGVLDYRVGMASLPTVNPRYSPRPGQRLRPAAGAGVRVGPALHAGVSLTHGPYLGPAVATLLPDGVTWKDFDQTVEAADVRLSLGYFETHLEAAWSSYEVPTLSKTVHGFGWYDEMRATLSPRVFAAARFEYFRYAFIGAFPPKVWIGAETIERNIEMGMGYRLTEAALLKVSYRRDFWPPQSGPGAPLLPDGSALAAQVSYHLDISELLAGKH
jgi:hypothetical protein